MPQNIMKHVKKVWVHCCVCFTLLILLLFLIGSAVPAFGNAIEVSNILTVFLFSLLLACANLLLHVTTLPLALRVLLHYLATMLTFYAVFILIAAKASGIPAILSLLIFYTLLYAVFMGVYLFLSHTVLRSRKKRDAEYKRIYKS